jgi:prepilin-type N-terminal cleavage/methylation domain-containing protein
MKKVIKNQGIKLKSLFLWFLRGSLIQPQSKSKGFTLIEIVIVLAITALTILIVLGGFNTTQQRTQFRDAIEHVSTNLERVKSEANTTINVTSTTPGTDKNRIVFAKVVEFTNGSDTATVSTLSASNFDTIQNLNLESPTEQINIPWGVQYETSTHRYVVFARSPLDGSLRTYVFPAATVITNPAVYNGFTDTIGVFEFRDPTTDLEATVRVDSATSTITRSYDN